MKQKTINTIKQAMVKVQEAIKLLEKVKGESETIDEVSETLEYVIADMEYESN